MIAYEMYVPVETVYQWLNGEERPSFNQAWRMRERWGHKFLDWVMTNFEPDWSGVSDEERKKIEDDYNKRHYGI